MELRPPISTRTYTFLPYSTPFRSMVFACFDAAVMTLIPVYLLRSGFTAEVGAAALSAMLIGMVLAQFPVGWLLDRFRRASVIAGCSLTAALGCAVLPWSLALPWVFWPLMVVLGGASRSEEHTSELQSLM